MTKKLNNKRFAMLYRKEKLETIKDNIFIILAGAVMFLYACWACSLQY